MRKWEYSMRYVSLDKYEKDKKGNWKRAENELVNISAIWDAPWTEKTQFSYIQEMGSQGWEMISAVPITGGIHYGGGYTTHILFTFKRPLPDSDKESG